VRMTWRTRRLAALLSAAVMLLALSAPAALADSTRLCNKDCVDQDNDFSQDNDVTTNQDNDVTNNTNTTNHITNNTDNDVCGHTGTGNVSGNISC
jgi:hypothetical protein